MEGIYAKLAKVVNYSLHFVKKGLKVILWSSKIDKLGYFVYLRTPTVSIVTKSNIFSLFASSTN